jgi:uncharacterized protein (DUF1501 family)
MSMPLPLNRRTLLTGLGGVSLSFVGRAAWAGETARKKLVVIIARGALDGLSVSPPYGDPNYLPLRGALALPAPGQDGGALRLDDTFGLHPTLVELHAMALAGEARIAPAVAIPERIRSHFEAQDMLENGTAKVYSTNSGWLNRALAAQGSTRGLSVGTTAPLVLRGPVQAASWAPGPNLPQNDRVASLLMDLYKDDPVLAPALASGLATEGMALTAEGDEAVKPKDVRLLGRTVARFMLEPQGPDVVAISLDGWDTHAGQKAQLQARLPAPDQLIAGLKDGLGPEWRDTVVILATEFGRTARTNGTGGTDHGTGSTLILAGGAVKGAGIIGDWPTLADNKLFENRDLNAALDIRAVFKGVLRDHLGVDRAKLDTVVFPDSAEVRAVTGLV